MLFADPEFDGDPALVTEEEMAANGETVGDPKVVEERPIPKAEALPAPVLTFDDDPTPPRKYYVDGGRG